MVAEIMNVMPFGTKLQSKTWQNNTYHISIIITHNTIRNDTFFHHLWCTYVPRCGLDSDEYLMNGTFFTFYNPFVL